MDRNWHEGTIGIPVNKAGTKIAHYWVKAFQRGSKYGINDGRISKLRIDINGETVADYDRDWYIKPAEDDQAAQIAYYICLDQYN